MVGTSNTSVEEQVKQLAAMPLPRRVRPTTGSGHRLHLLFLIVLSCLGWWSYEHRPGQNQLRNLLVTGIVVSAIAMRVGIMAVVGTDLLSRNLLRNGTPTVGRVLSNERSLGGQWIAFSYEVAPKTIMEGRMRAYRNLDLQKGTSVVVFYDPEFPDRSLIQGCKLWDVDFSAPETTLK